MTILDEYRKLKWFRKFPEHPLFDLTNHERLAKQNKVLKSLCQQNQDELYNLIFSGKLKCDEIVDLINFTEGKTFVNQIKNNISKLPKEMQSKLKWEFEQNGW